MAYLQGLFTQILALLPHPYLAPLIGAFFGGEETILVIAALAAGGGALSFTEVLVLSFLGTIISDTLWFVFGAYSSSWLRGRPRMNEKLDTVGTFVNRFTRGRFFFALLITKFLYGTRIVMIFFLSSGPMTLGQFTLQNIVVTGIWSTVICSIGWFAGQKLPSVEHAFGGISLAMSVVIAVIAVLYGVRIWLNKKVVEQK